MTGHESHCSCQMPVLKGPNYIGNPPPRCSKVIKGGHENLGDVGADLGALLKELATQGWCRIDKLSRDSQEMVVHVARL